MMKLLRKMSEINFSMPKQNILELGKQIRAFYINYKMYLVLSYSTTLRRKAALTETCFNH